MHPMITRSKLGITKPKRPFSLSVITLSLPLPTEEPTHFSEAVKHSVWQKAMDEEFSALVKQGTWTLVPPPSHGHVIGC